MKSITATPRVHGIKTRVYYGDTDQMGVAYYANYLRWFEMARNAYMHAVGCPHSGLERKAIFLPVTETACRYIRPARYDDVLRLETRLTQRSRLRLRFDYRVWRLPDAELLAEGHTVHACLNAQRMPRRFPEELLEALARFEAGLTEPRPEEPRQESC